MATSTQNLLGLADHLQSMELNFASILMESALKLASLTDSNIFVLVETPEGRRFAGKQHLCEAYVQGQLYPTESDVEMTVNHNVSSLAQKNKQTDMTYRKTPQLPKKRSHYSQDITDLDRVPKKKIKEECAPAIQENHPGHNPNVPSLRSSGQSPSRSRNDDLSHLDDDQYSSGANASYNVPASDVRGTDVRAADVAYMSYEESDITQWVHDKFLIINSKVDAINVIDPRNIEDRESDERKLLRSLCFDFGKFFCTEYLTDGAEFLENSRIAFDAFWAHFANFHEYQNLMIPYRKGKFMGLKSLCRAMINRTCRDIKSRKKTNQDIN